MSENARSWVSRVVSHRIPVVASLAIGSLALVASVVIGAPIGGPVAFGQPTANTSDASAKMIYADPNPISVCNGATAETTLYWNIGRNKGYKLFKGANTEPFTQGTGSGKYTVQAARVGDAFRIETFTTRIQTTKSGNRQVKTPVQIKDGTATVTISLNAATDCAPVAPAPLEVPRVTCNPNPQTTEVGKQVTFTALGGVGGYTWTSTGATPATASGASYVLSYASAGSKTVTVASGNQTATCQVTVAAVNPAPATLSCTPGTQSVGVGQPATVTTNATGTANVTYTWSAIGASSSIRSGNSLVVTYSTPGNKTVTVDNYTTQANCTIVVTATAPPAPVAPVRVGQLVNKAGTVYLVGDNGLIGIPSLAVFNSWCFNFNELIEANAAETNLSQVGVLELRANGQLLPTGVSVLRVTTCPAVNPAPPAPVSLSCASASPTVEAGKPIKFTALGGDGESSYRWTAMDALPVINYVSAPFITPSFAAYSDGLTPYEYPAAVVVYSGAKSAQCSVKVVSAPTPPQPVALDPNASCDSNSYIRPLNIIPNVAGDTTANAKKLIDGDQNTVWSGPNNTSSYWITLDLGEQFKISKLCLKPQLTGNGTYVRYGISVYDDYANSNNYDGFSEHHFPSTASAPGAWVGLQTSGLGRFVRVYFSAPTILSPGATTVPALAFSELKLVGAAKNGAYQVPVAEPVVPEVMYICSASGGAGADTFQYTARGAGESTLSSTAENYQGVAIRSGLISIQLGAGNTQNTYTFIHGGVTKIMRTLPEPGPCAKTTKLSLSIPSNGIPLCPTQNQYTQIQAVGQIEHAPAGYALKPTDKVTGVYVNTMTGQTEQLPDIALKTTVNLNTFVFAGLPYTVKAPGYAIYTLVFNDQALSKQYSAGWASNFCIPPEYYR